MDGEYRVRKYTIPKKSFPNLETMTKVNQLNEKQDIMYKLAKKICEYLRLNEDLFFCGGHINHRTGEGRKYFCYIAVQDYNIPASFVRKFLGFAVTHTVQKHHKNLRKQILHYPTSQASIDINGIIELCKDQLKAA